MTKYQIKIKDPNGVWILYSDTIHDWMSTAAYRVIELKDLHTDCEFKIVATIIN